MFSILAHKIGSEGDKISRKKTGEVLAETVFFPEILEFTSKEAAAPLMSLAAPLWFWKFWKKILDFGIFFRNFEFFENFENYEL